MPVRPEVKLGDYTNFNFKPEIETIDDAQGRQGDRRAARPERDADPVEDRGAKNGDYAVIGSRGPATAQPFEGGSAERMPLILGEERLIPGFEENLVGLKVGDHEELRHHVPGRLRRGSLAGQAAHFDVEVRELREKVLPEADDEFARSMGDFADLADDARGDPPAARAQRPRPGAPRVRRPDHRVRGRQRHARAAGRPGRPGGRGDARRVPWLARAPGDLRGGVPEGHRARRDADLHAEFRPARREAGQGPARPVEGRRGRGRRGARGGGRGRGRARARALRERPEARAATSTRSGAASFIRSSLRRSRTGREARRRLAGRPPGAPAAPARRGSAPSAIDRPP